MVNLQQKATGLLQLAGLAPTGPYDAPTSATRFPDGSELRVEISSVENPATLAAVVDEAGRRVVRVDRVSQGSGVNLLTDGELDEMVELGAAHDIEVCLWVGQRSGWATGAQPTSTNGRVTSAAVPGQAGLLAACAEAVHGASRGVRSLLVADLGLLQVLSLARAAGDLPADLVLKGSASLPVTNAMTARLVEDLGADTINLPVDLSLPDLAAIRAAVTCPLDVYVEAPDDFGGVVRHHEVTEIVRVCAPVYVKFAVRNAAPIYPVGMHTAALVEALARERVRRAQLSLGILARERQETTPGGAGSDDG